MDDHLILTKYLKVMERKDQRYNFDEEELLVAAFVIFAMLSYAVTTVVLWCNSIKLKKNI